MNILIAGGSGFIGKELVSALSGAHRVSVLGRDITHLQKIFPNNIHTFTWADLANQDAKQFDIIINLSGSNIGAGRWTGQIKQELISSRTFSNKELINWLQKQNARPRYYCANAIGIYGAYYDDTPAFDEDSVLDNDVNKLDFLKNIGLAWQQSLVPAIESGIPVTTLRFGVVLKKGEGMLKKLELPFSFGIGSVMGSGQQIISWIHYEDLVRAVSFLLEHPSITGPVNLTSPQPVTQKEFAADLAAALKRPLFLKTPAFVIKTLFGEMGNELVLKGQRVIPKRLLGQQFSFTYPALLPALVHEYQHSK